MDTETGTGSVDPILGVPPLTVASLLPKEFSLDWLVALSGLGATAAIRAMEEGVARGLLQQQSPGVYSFSGPEKQAECLSPYDEQEREALHRCAAHLIRDRLADQEEMGPVLAHLLMRTTNDLEDCRFLYDEGSRLHRARHKEQALLCFERIIRTLQTYPGPEEDRLFVDGVIMYARIFNHQRESSWIQAMILEALGRSQARGVASFRPLLKMHLAKFLAFSGQPAESQTHFQEGWAMAEESGNPDILYRALTFRMFFYTWQGRFRDVVRVYEEDTQMVERFPRSSFPVSATSHLGYSLVLAGRIGEGIGMLHALYEHCRSIDEVDNLNLIFLSLAQSYLSIGRPEEGMVALKQIMTFPEERLNHYYGSLSYYRLAAEAHALRTEYDRATHLLSRGDRQLGPDWIFLIRSDGCNRMAAGMSDDAIYRLTGHTPEEIIQSSLDYRCIYQQAMAYLFMGRRLMVRKGGSEDILEVLLLAEERLAESGHEIQLAKARLDQARIHLALGNEKQAAEAYLKAHRVLDPINPSLIPEETARLFAGHPETTDLRKDLSDLGLEIIAMQDPRDLVSHLLSSVNRLTGAERGGIFLATNQTGPPEIELHAAKNLSEDRIADPSFGPSMDIILETIVSGTPRMVSADVADVPRQPYSSDSAGFSSCFCLPLTAKGLKGVLYHDNRFLDPSVQEPDLDDLFLLAKQAALALDNAWRYTKTQRAAGALLQEHYAVEDIQRSRFDDFVGDSRPMRRVFEQISRVAGEDTVVLIEGETGVGKELVARTIHKQSGRQRPFVGADCSALTETIITSELFGHEKGAFTGALDRKIGRFELAHGGTLFLDEIGNVPMEVQVRLLRVLQTKEFQRVGGIETIHSDFRLVTATNRNLGREVEAGRFREDLYYRLNVFPIHVPSLRERKEDIPALALFFLRKESARMDRSFDSIPKGEIEKLLEYSWPGNVRELQNIIERGIILSSGSQFRVPELGGDRSHTPDTELTTLAENERRHILRVLEATRGKVKGIDGAARMLGLPDSTLFSRMKKLGVRIRRKAVGG